MTSRTPFSTSLNYEMKGLETGITNGFQIALDPIAGRVWLTDAQWREESRDPGGRITLAQPASGKLAVFDTARVAREADHSFLGLSRNDGSGPEAGPLDWTHVPGARHSSMATGFSPYGVAVDGAVPGPDGQPRAVIVTTSARAADPRFGYGGHVVVCPAAQGAPRDEDRIWCFDDGSPIFDGIRRIAVNRATHRAYVTNIGEYREAPDRRPGFVAEIDLIARRVTARVPMPLDSGPVGIAVDELNDLIYVGSMVNPRLHVIRIAEIDRSDPRDLACNARLARPLPAHVGSNARPEFDPVSQRLCVAVYGRPEGRVLTLDADPASPEYGTILHTAPTGPVNAVLPDPARGLIYAALLDERALEIRYMETLRPLMRLTTSGQPVNMVREPHSGDVWVSNLGPAGKVDILRARGPLQGADLVRR